jgi:hypothetical protein
MDVVAKGTPYDTISIAPILAWHLMLVVLMKYCTNQEHFMVSI